MKRFTALLSVLTVAQNLASAGGQAHLTTIYTTTDTYPTLLAQANGAFYFQGINPSGGQCDAIYSLAPATAGQEWVATSLYAFGTTIGDACFPSSVLLPGHRRFFLWSKSAWRR